MMDSPELPTAPSETAKPQRFGDLIARLRKRRIVETLAAFVGGGWLLLEFVHWILVDHYHFPEKTIDITFVTILGALIITLIWRWFSGREKPRRLKPELVLIPLVLLVTGLLDINLLLHLKGPEATVAPAPEWKNSIAVLPFVDMSPQKDQEYFCDGMTEDLINRLSNIRDLKVPARTSAFMFKGKTPDMREVGEKLKVRTALEGSIQKSGDRLRITAQLINIADGYHLWSERYDRKLKDVFAIQDEIASAIVEALRLELSDQESSRIGGHAIDNSTAYELYLRARYEIWRFREDTLDRTVQDLQRALEITGPNALLYSALADAYWQYVNIGAEHDDYAERAEDYAKKALAIEAGLSGAYVTLGYLAEYRDQQEAIRHFKKALAMNPNEPIACRRLALIYLNAGRPAAARLLMERFRAADPLNPYHHLLQGVALTYEGQFGPALDAMRRWYQLDPENPFRGCQYALLLIYNKAYDEAFSIIDRNAEMAPSNVVTKFGLLLKCGLLMDGEKAFGIMTPDFQKTCRRDPEWSYLVAQSLALLDAKKEALDWLENAGNRGFINYPYVNTYDVLLANLRGEERFKKLMERVKYEWEHFDMDQKPID